MKLKLLALIFLLGFSLRVISLGSLPAGFTPDEASQGYSAYSLLKTGKDEWGVSWPLSSFKSFLDYKAPLQTYLMIPTVAIFGLNEFAVRLPSVIFGTLAILAIYLLTNKLFPGKKIRIGSVDFDLGHFAAFFLAISPWHLQFSRMALEVNLASFLFPMGLYFFLEGFEKPKKFIYVAILWSFSLYTYHAAKVFIPLFAITLLVIFWQKIITNFKNLYTSALIAVVICSPLLFGTLFGSAGKRGGDLLITKLDLNQLTEIHNNIAFASYRTPGFIVEKLFHNKAVYSVSLFVENYLSYFNPSFWFTEGGREITYSIIPGRGLLYFWQLPLILLAILYIYKNTSRSSKKVLIAWFLLAAIPAALTKEGYRPNRAGSYALFFEMLTAPGLYYALTELKVRRYVAVTAIIIFSVLTIAYFEDYYSSSQIKYPTSLSFGWRDAINYANSVQSNYSSVQIEQGSQPQSFVAFYTPVPPLDFQKASAEWDEQISGHSDIQYLDQLGDYSLGKFRFKSFSWPENINEETLYLSQTMKNLPEKRRTLYIVKGADDLPLMEVFDFKQ